jgi:hypothetical protein
MNTDQLNEKYCYGQMMIRKKSLLGKKTVAYIVDQDAGYQHLVKMAHKLPYNIGDDHFFVHMANLTRLWHHAKEGIQTKLFK